MPGRRSIFHFNVALWLLTSAVRLYGAGIGGIDGVIGGGGLGAQANTNNNIVPTNSGILGCKLKFAEIFAAGNLSLTEIIYYSSFKLSDILLDIEIVVAFQRR